MYKKFNDDAGAIWIKEKIKEKNGKRIKSRYLCFYVRDENGNKKWYVAFASGKKADGNPNYPDFIVYAQQRDNEYQQNNSNGYSNGYDDLKPKKLEEIENEEDDNIDF